jgi:DNA-binding IclR family transcriptional regulator
MSGVMTRTLAILERLASEVHGVPLATLADELDMPRSGAHRLLTELCEHGYVRQSRERGTYMLTTRLVSLGLNFLKTSGVVDICQPILDRLAESCGELVRLAVVDVDHITWVGLSQGARSGLRYDPDMGIDAKLSCTSSGFIWLSTLVEDDAIALISRQGLASPAEYGPNAPGSVAAVLAQVRLAGERGYGLGIETYAHGLSAIAAAICPNGRDAVGVLAISGPTARLGAARLHALASDLLAAASDIAAISSASPLFDRVHPRLDLPMPTAS